MNSSSAASQRRFLQLVARHAPGVPTVYASTRQLYGVPQYLPVDELHPTSPVDINGIGLTTEPGRRLARASAWLQVQPASVR